MEILKSIVLGLLQGFTEFLPVSSSGHLVVLQEILNVNFDGGSLFFELMLHVGTLCALLVVFFKDILGLLKPPFKTIWMLVVASIPAVIVMALFKEQIESISTSKFVCFGFLLTAILLFVTECLAKKTKGQKPFTYKTALLMGLAQSIAVLPGISRSGSTISAGVLSDHKKTDVAKFSFFMSMVVISGSAVLQVFDLPSAANVDFLPIFCGMIAAAVSGYVAIKLMMKIVEKSNYKWFSLYLILAFAVTFCDNFVVNIF